jgi:hypothetical protein
MCCGILMLAACQHPGPALEPGELYAKRPKNTHIDKGDLDLHRDFVIAAR